jgi:hypothetical protein
VRLRSLDGTTLAKAVNESREVALAAGNRKAAGVDKFFTIVPKAIRAGGFAAGLLPQEFRSDSRIFIKGLMVSLAESQIRSRT